MKNIAYLIVLFIIIISCKKDQLEEKITINSQDFFLEMTDIDKLKKTEKTKLNDSTYRIRGFVNSLQVTGYLTQNDEKIDWWEVADTNGKKVATIEYRIVDKKVFANQYKVFNNSELDIYKSKNYKTNHHHKSVLPKAPRRFRRFVATGIFRLAYQQSCPVVRRD